MPVVDQRVRTPRIVPEHRDRIPGGNAPLMIPPKRRAERQAVAHHVAELTPQPFGLVVIPVIPLQQERRQARLGRRERLILRRVDGPIKLPPNAQTATAAESELQPPAVAE